MITHTSTKFNGFLATALVSVLLTACGGTQTTSSSGSSTSSTGSSIGGSTSGSTTSTSSGSSSGNYEGGIAGGNPKFLGNIIASNVPSNYNDYWNQVTPENGGKWGSVEQSRDNYNWSDQDRAYYHAKNNDMPFKGHTLVWGNQEPNWIGGLSQNEQQAEVEEWIRDYCNRYPDTDFLDVVNEPTNDPASFRNALGGSGSTGWDWVVWSYEKARQYCPNVKLILNDYNIINYAINPDAESNANQFLNIVDILKARGLIDGIGLQTHAFSVNGVNSWDKMTPNLVRQALDRFGNTGLPVYISELDIDDTSSVNQCEKYKELFPPMWEHNAIEGITLWGYIEGQTWRNNTNSGIVTSNGSEKAAMRWLKQYFQGNGSAGC